MSKKCIYCGNGYDEDFSNASIVQEIGFGKMAVGGGIYYDENGFKTLKSDIFRNSGMVLSRTILKIVSEKRVLNISTSIDENDENCIEVNLDIVCCPFCGRKFE